jgi:hypothetical protein
MARCINVNLEEFKVISKELKSDLNATLLINKWQDSIGDTEAIPTLDQALEFMKNQKIAFNLKVTDTASSLYKNLVRKKNIHSIGGRYYVSRTRANNQFEAEAQLRDVVNPNTGLTRIAYQNMQQIKSYFEYYNIPFKQGELFTQFKNKNGKLLIQFNIPNGYFMAKDVVRKARGFDKPKSRKIAQHLKSMFPGLKIEFGKASNLEKLYDKIPQYAKKGVSFENVNSFQFEDTVYLIDSRVTDEILVEEMLHPFVDAVYFENNALFKSLEIEARRNFPKLAQQINEAYNAKNLKFTFDEQQKELVTQALARHFKQEYENEPTKSFLQRVKEFIEFYIGILRSIFKAINGDSKSLNVEEGFNFIKNVLTADPSARSEQDVSTPIEDVKRYIRENKIEKFTWDRLSTDNELGKLLDKIENPSVKAAYDMLKTQLEDFMQLKTNADAEMATLYQEANIDEEQLAIDESNQLKNVNRVAKGLERIETPELDKYNQLRETKPELYDKIEETADQDFDLTVKGSKAFTDQVNNFFNAIMEFDTKELPGAANDIRLNQTVLQALPKGATLSQLATFLNTTGIQFELAELSQVSDQAAPNPRVKYNLTPRKKTALDKIKKTASSGIQSDIIDKLFHTAVIGVNNSDFFTVTNQFGNKNLVVFDNTTRTYMDILSNGKTYTAAEELVKGLTKYEESFLSDDVRKDFRTITEAIAQRENFESIESALTTLTKEQAENAFIRLSENINGIVYGDQSGNGNVVIPQVTVYDVDTSTATTVDLMSIEPSGKIKLINLSINEGSQYSSKYDALEELGSDSRLKPIINKLSSRQQDYIGVNVARRMLENMGYDVSLDDSSAMTFHIDFNPADNTYKYDNLQIHTPNDNETYVDALVPSTLINRNREEYRNMIENDPSVLVDMDKILTPEEMQPENFGTEFIDPDVGLTVVTGALEGYKKGLMKKQEALDTLRSKVFMSKSTDKTKEDIIQSLSQINIALGSGIKERNKIYSSLLLKAVGEIKSFKKFVSDPKNVSDPDFITYVLNAKRFLSTYEGLYVVLDSGQLNATQTALILQLRTLLTELAGEGEKQGIIKDAIEDFVKLTIKNKSSYNFTEEELDAIIKFGAKPEDFIKGETKGRDVDVLEYGTKDLATSRDTLSAIADKMYKAKVIQRNQIVEEKIEKNLNLAGRLLRLSDNKNRQELFDYMIQFDENGIPTGMVIQELGSQYYDKRSEVFDKLKDKEGNFKRYRDIPNNILEANEEDLEYNRQLALDKQEVAKFSNAQTIGPNNQPVDGEYHMYTAEFKKKLEETSTFVPVGDNGYWTRDRNKVTQREYDKFYAKYYDVFEYDRAERDSDGNFTGRIIKTQSSAPKKIYTVPRLESSKGEDMMSAKYRSMTEDTSALGKARLAYYRFYTKEMEGDLLQRLPRKQRDQMAGKMPLIRSNFLQDLSDKDPLVVKMFAKTKKNIKNFFSTTVQNRVVFTDEKGKQVDSLPIYYTGNPVDQKQLDELNAEIADLKKQRQDGKINIDNYKNKLAELKGQLQRLESKPTKGQINKDLAASLAAFTEMAVNYDMMSSIEDTIIAIKEVMENREYQPSNSMINLGKFDIKGKFQRLGKKDKDQESNITARYKKWLHMVYYDDESITRGFLEKSTEAIIKYSSLSYVAFNPFGNFNNYALGRVNDNIEAIGGRFFSWKSYQRASLEFNKRALPDLMWRLGSTTKKTAADFGKGESQYDVSKPFSKYESLTDIFYMMDKASDVRETGRSGPGAKSKLGMAWSKFEEIGYSMQDAAEYNVQTKVGMAILMDTYVRSNKTGEVISIYDAYKFDSKTGKSTISDEYDTIIEKVGKDSQGAPITVEKPFNNEFIYETRNKIREVNKQIHGNYAKEDRMVIESYAWGRLLAQFHKWVAPAMRARFQREYYDENLGWMEGRYLSLIKGLKFFGERLVKVDTDFKNWNKKFLQDYGYTEGKNIQMDQRATNKLFNIYRTLGEASMMIGLLTLRSMLEGFMSMDDDDEDDVMVYDSLQTTPESETAIRLRNLLAYQVDRTYKELILFVPLLPAGLEQQYQMVKSPIASTRTLGELGKAISLSIWTPVAYWAQSEEDFMNNSEFVYQRGKRAGELKVYKEWKDAVPILYAIKKWENYIDKSDFFIK